MEKLHECTRQLKAPHKTAKIFDDRKKYVVQRKRNKRDQKAPNCECDAYWDWFQYNEGEVKKKNGKKKQGKRKS